MININIEKTGEFFMPTDSNPDEVLINLERYFFAANFCKDKVVLDAGHGAGMGTYLYSLVAKRVIAVDRNGDARKYAKQFPFDEKKVQFVDLDLEKDVLPDHEITVALESIEHLKNPDFFLSQLKGKEIIFSIPRNSLAVSKFHLYDFRGLEDIKEMMERYYTVPEYFNQYDKWIFGKGVKK